MKLVRFGRVGQEKPGILDTKGRIRDLSPFIADLTPDQITPEGLDEIRYLTVDALEVVEDQDRFGVPIKGIGKFLAVGLNYSDHAAESNLPIPSEPIFFTKATSCLNGPNDPIMIPHEAEKVDWEVELGVVIGRTCRYVQRNRALAHVAGYVLVNDVSERNFQKERGSQWDKGKGCDTFGPVGPWLVTADEVPDPQNLDMFLDVNATRMQTGNTSKMIFPVDECISYMSRFVTLYPGDLIITGTPPGVGEGKKPNPVFLAAGDNVRLGITGLGEQRQAVIAFNKEILS